MSRSTAHHFISRRMNMNGARASGLGAGSTASERLRYGLDWLSVQASRHVARLEAFVYFAVSMPHPKLLRLAEAEVQRTLERLPAEVREAAAECLVSFEDLADAAADDDLLAEDLLGLFEGLSRL